MNLSGSPELGSITCSFCVSVQQRKTSVKQTSSSQHTTSFLYPECSSRGVWIGGDLTTVSHLGHCGMLVWLFTLSPFISLALKNNSYVLVFALYLRLWRDPQRSSVSGALV